MKNIVKIAMMMFIALACIILIPSVSKADEPTSGNIKVILTVEGVFPDYDSSHISGMNCISEVYYSVKNSDGEYLCFNDSFEYTGKQNEPCVITVSTEQFQNYNDGKSSVVTFSGIPNGNYTIEFTQKDGECVKHAESTFDCVANPGIDNVDISINGNTATADTSVMLKAIHKYVLYYIDETGSNEKIYWRFGKRDLYKFNYHKDSDGNNVYEWDKNGTVEDIEIVSGERTFVYPPIGDAGVYNVSSKINPNCILLNTNGTVHETGSWNYEREDDYTGSDSIYFPIREDMGFAYVYTRAEKAYTIDKKGNDGVTINSQFVLSNSSNGRIQKKAIFDHYDTYELNGNEYSNVYVVKGFVDNNESTTNEGIIETIEGKATIIYPLVEFNGNTTWAPTHYYLYEVGTDADYLFNKQYYCGEIIGEKYGLVTTLDGNAFPSSAGRMSGNIDQISYDDIEVSIDSDIEDEIIANIVNEKKPSVTKIVLDEDGNVDEDCDETFKFGLFKVPTNNQEDYELIAIVEIKANETKTFDVQINDNTQDNYYGSGNYIIAEFINDNYYVSNVELEGHDGSVEFMIPEGKLILLDRRAMPYRYVSQFVLNAIFTNVKKTMPSVTKHVLDYYHNEIENCDDTFEFVLLDESLRIVSTVEVSANEETYFDAFNELYSQGKVFYIVEVRKNGYQLLPDVSKVVIPAEIKSQIEQNLGKEIGAYAIKYECDFASQPRADFYNEEKAKITIKKEIEDNIDCDEEFTFAIYNALTSELITKVNVKAGESVELNCENLGIKNGMKIIIVEENKEGYELVKLADIDERIGQKELIEDENELNLSGWVYNIRYVEIAPSEVYNLVFTNKATEVPVYEEKELVEQKEEKTTEGENDADETSEKDVKSIKTGDFVIVYGALLIISFGIILYVQKKIR